MCVHAGICNHEWKHNLFISSRKACPVWIMELIYSKGHYCENKWKCYKCKTRFYVPLFCISISCSSREKTLIYTEDPIRLHDNPGTFPNTFGRNWIKVQDKYWRKNSCTCLDVNLYDVFEFILKKRLIVSILWAPFVYKFRPHQLYFLCVRNYSLFRGFLWSQRRIWEWVKVVEFNSHAVVKDKADMYLCCYNFS